MKKKYIGYIADVLMIVVVIFMLTQIFPYEFALQYLDEDMNVANTYGIRSYPTTIAVNKKGEVIGGYIGMLTYEQMEQLYSFFE